MLATTSSGLNNQSQSGGSYNSERTDSNIVEYGETSTSFFSTDYKKYVKVHIYIIYTYLDNTFHFQFKFFFMVGWLKCYFFYERILQTWRLETNARQQQGQS